MTDSVVFTGGANVPTADSWRLNASMPFARLVVSGTTVTLEVAKAARFVGDPVTLHAIPRDIALVYPLRGRFVGRGVGFRTVAGADFYFWTYSGRRLLNTLRDRGFTVSATFERPRKVWSGEP